MSTMQLDYSVGIGKESTYGTAVTPTRFFEAEAQMKFDLQTEQSKMMRLGKRANRINRNVLKHVEVSGDMSVEAATKGLGFLLGAALGAVTNTQIPSTSPAVYQQVHTLKKADWLDSFTIQEVLPTLGSAGVGNAHTFTGCMVNQIDISGKEGAPVEVKLAWLGKDLSTAIAGTAASYPTGDDLLTFIHGSIGYAGTLTAPTTTALGSLSGAAASNVTDFQVSIANNLDSGGYTLGGAGKRSRPNAVGVAGITGKLTAEYTDNTLRDAYLNRTALPLVLTFQHTNLLSATPSNTYALLQIVIPAVLLKGEVPTSNGSQVITQSIDFEAFDNASAAEPIWIVYRTLDTTP